MANQIGEILKDIKGRSWRLSWSESDPSSEGEGYFLQLESLEGTEWKPRTYKHIAQTAGCHKISELECVKKAVDDIISWIQANAPLLDNIVDTWMSRTFMIILSLKFVLGEDGWPTILIS